MGWAVIETLPEYHPEGDPERTSTEFVWWIFSDKKKAMARKKELADKQVRVEEVEGAWDAPAKTEHKKEN